MDLFSEGNCLCCAKETDEVSGFLSDIISFSQKGKKNLIHHLNIIKLFNMPYTILLQTVDVAFY